MMKSVESMTGSDLRALLADWKISRRLFADALSAAGLTYEVKAIDRWTTNIPNAAVRLIDCWRDHPEERPVKLKQHRAMK